MTPLNTALRNAATLRFLKALPPGERDLVNMYYRNEHNMPYDEVENVADEYMDLDWVYRTYGREIEA